MNSERDQDKLDREIPEKLRRLAVSAKTISLNDPRVQKHLDGDRQSHTQYRNNFFGIFGALSLFIRTGSVKGNLFYDVNLCKLTDAGVNPQEFYKTNKDLCENLFEALDGERDYTNLFTGVKNLFRDGKDDAADRLDATVPNPLGIESVAMYAWDKINPLLEEADNILKEMGIDTKEFSG
jgi:hypothetical protein